MIQPRMSKVNNQIITVKDASFLCKMVFDYQRINNLPHDTMQEPHARRSSILKSIHPPQVPVPPASPTIAFR